VPAPVPRLRGHLAAVVVLLGLQDLLQLAVVEEDAPAVLTLPQVHPLLVDGMHRSLALGAYHGASIRAKVMVQRQTGVVNMFG